MSTLRRAREHLALAQDAFADGIPDRQRLVSIRLKLASWGDHIATLRENRHAVETATWLFGAGCLCGSLWELQRYLTENTTGCSFRFGPRMKATLEQELRLVLDAAEQCADQWEASEIDTDDPEPAPVTENGRVGGLSRTATIRHTCGCESTLRLSGCNDDTWRAAMRMQAAEPCARCKIAAADAALTDDERQRRAMALWE